MQITGRVHEIGQTQQVTDTFKKRDIIVEYAENPQYPEFLRFESTQDRVTIFDDLTPGDEVEVSFNLRGRPWTNKEGVTTYFNSLVAWRVVKTGNQTARPAPPVDISQTEQEDDLPFNQGFSVIP